MADITTEYEYQVFVSPIIEEIIYVAFFTRHYLSGVEVASELMELQIDKDKVLKKFNIRVSAKVSGWKHQQKKKGVGSEMVADEGSVTSRVEIPSNELEGLLEDLKNTVAKKADSGILHFGCFRADRPGEHGEVYKKIQELFDEIA